MEYLSDSIKLNHSDFTFEYGTENNINIVVLFNDIGKAYKRIICYSHNNPVKRDMSQYYYLKKFTFDMLNGEEL